MYVVACPSKQQYAPVHQRLVAQICGVVDKIASREVVCAVDDDVVLGNDVECVVGCDWFLMDPHVDIGIVRLECLVCGFRLGPANVVVLVQNLALEVGHIHRVKIDDADCAHARKGQIDGYGRAKPARADDQHLGVEHLALSGAANLRHNDVPAVALHLVRC